MHRMLDSKKGRDDPSSRQRGFDALHSLSQLPHPQIWIACHPLAPRTQPIHQKFRRCVCRWLLANPVHTDGINTYLSHP